MKKLINMALISLSLLWLGGCASSITGHGEAIDKQQLNSVKTYAFISDRPLLRSDPNFPKLKVGQIEQDLRNAISNELDAKGYLKADLDRADILVAFGVSTRERTDIYDVYMARRFNYPSQVVHVDAHKYIEGALIIDFFSGDDGRQIWHGWAKERFHRKPSDEHRQEKINQGVKAILENFQNK